MFKFLIGVAVGVAVTQKFPNQTKASKDYVTNKIKSGLDRFKEKPIGASKNEEES